jgi:hypothetical protein
MKCLPFAAIGELLFRGLYLVRRYARRHSVWRHRPPAAMFLYPGSGRARRERKAPAKKAHARSLNAGIDGFALRQGRLLASTHRSARNLNPRRLPRSTVVPIQATLLAILSAADDSSNDRARTCVTRGCTDCGSGTLRPTVIILLLLRLRLLALLLGSRRC